MIEAVGGIIAGNAPVFLLIAGPNGASKSTFSEKRLKPLGFPTIDPDAVGQELFGRYAASPEEGLLATQEATRKVRQCFQERSSVALETVFSDTRGYKLGLIREARAAGFRTVLIFVGVDSPEICIARVLDRVEQGGHNVADEVIRDRFPKCFKNLKTALKLVDLTILIDNSGCYGPDGLVLEGQRHYEFGIIECGKSVQLQPVLPRWFAEFGVGDLIEASCQPKSQA